MSQFINAIVMMLAYVNSINVAFGYNFTMNTDTLMETQTDNELKLFYFTGSSSPPKPGYLRNPFSGTDYRLVNISKTWLDARSYCWAARERLATFHTLESVYWMKNIRHTMHSEFYCSILKDIKNKRIELVTRTTSV